MEKWKTGIISIAERNRFELHIKHYIPAFHDFHLKINIYSIF
jgi:hypothetical protein